MCIKKKIINLTKYQDPQEGSIKNEATAIARFRANLGSIKEAIQVSKGRS
jgi:hypothetical protein